MQAQQSLKGGQPLPTLPVMMRTRGHGAPTLDYVLPIQRIVNWFRLKFLAGVAQTQYGLVPSHKISVTHGADKYVYWHAQGPVMSRPFDKQKDHDLVELMHPKDQLFKGASLCHLPLPQNATTTFST